MAYEFLNNKRYVDIFNELVNEYVDTGEPVSSRTLAKRMGNALSPATIRNVMADLEDLGVLYSEHTSSGRKPTEKGWRYFVNSLVEVSCDIKDLHMKQLCEIENNYCGCNIESILEKTSEVLSCLSKYASIILTPTVNDKTIKHIDFVALSLRRALVIIVTDDGVVENRLIEFSCDIPNETFEKAANYLNSKLCGLTLDDIRDVVENELMLERENLGSETSDVIQNGIDVWKLHNTTNKVIVRGQSNLLLNADEIEDLQVVMQSLEEKMAIKKILDESITGQGIQVFIGAENKVFNLGGCSMIVAPYKNSSKKIVGAIGVIGPARMKYDKLINLVDCTAKMLEKFV